MSEKKSITEVIEESEQETKVPLIFQIVVELVIGIFMIISQSATNQPEGHFVETLFIVIGILMVCYGVFDMIAFITNNRSYTFRQGLTSGVLITIVGVAFIVQHAELNDLLIPIFVGALIVIESVINCRRALIIKNLESKFWYILLILSLAMVAFGIIISVYPNVFGDVIDVIMGIAISVVAALDAYAIIYIIILRKNQKKIMEQNEQKTSEELKNEDKNEKDRNKGKNKD